MIMEVVDLHYGKLLLNIIYPIHISESVLLTFRIIMSINLMKRLYVHNTFLEILSESGTIGFLLYSAFLFILIFKLAQHTLFREKPYLLLTMIAFLFQMMSLSLIINEAFFLFLAVVVKYISIYKKEGER